jgi:hypothetical protein
MEDLEVFEAAIVLRGEASRVKPRRVQPCTAGGQTVKMGDEEFASSACGNQMAGRPVAVPPSPSPDAAPRA